MKSLLNKRAPLGVGMLWLSCLTLAACGAGKTVSDPGDPGGEGGTGGGGPLPDRKDAAPGGQVVADARSAPVDSASPTGKEDSGVGDGPPASAATDAPVTGDSARASADGPFPTDSAVVTPEGSLPDPWKDRDIGDVPMKGSATFKNGVFGIKAYGLDHWHDLDYFHYVYMPLKGDGEIVARVTGVDVGAAGVMFRNDPTFAHEPPGKITAPGAQFFYSPGGAVMWGERWRSTPPNEGWQPGPDTVRDTNYPTTNEPIKAPVWFKIVRKGTRYSGYYSKDGVTWVQATSSMTKRISENTLAPIESAETMWVGLFACPQNKGNGSTGATFDNVKVTPATPAP